MTKTQEWVTTTTCEDRNGNFREAGAIYPDKFDNKAMKVARPLVPGEAIVTCPRCGQRFAATEDGAPEEGRDLHYNGDEDIPSICARSSDDEKR